MASDNLPEEWRPVEGWPYEVSNLGRVRRAISSASTRGGSWPGRELNAYPDADGYLTVSLKAGDRRMQIGVHLLVLSAFCGPRPAAGMTAAHFDGAKGNNAANNLRWATPLENAADKFRHGTVLRGARHGRAKIDEAGVRDIRARVGAGQATQKSIASEFGVSRQMVWNIVSGRSWSWLD